MKNSRPQRNEIEAAYRHRYESVLKLLAKALKRHLADCLEGTPRIDRVSVRAKDIQSFVNKSNKQQNDTWKYDEPIEQIQDQVGARVIVFYQSDVVSVESIIHKYFTAIEGKNRIPDSQWEFGYFGKHYILTIPNDIVEDEWDKSLVPKFFELQIKTLFQHAWSEAEHDLSYKEFETSLNQDQNRRLAFTSAQAWGADRIFNELFEEIIQKDKIPK